MFLDSFQLSVFSPYPHRCLHSSRAGLTFASTTRRAVINRCRHFPTAVFVTPIFSAITALLRPTCDNRLIPRMRPEAGGSSELSPSSATAPSSSAVSTNAGLGRPVFMRAPSAMRCHTNPQYICPIHMERNTIFCSNNS